MMTYIKSAINNNIKSYYSNHANSKPSFTAPTELIKTYKINTKKSINAILIFQKYFKSHFKSTPSSMIINFS